MPATILVIVGFETLAQCHGDPLTIFLFCGMIECVKVLV